MMKPGDGDKWKLIGPLADFLQDELVLGAVRFTENPSFSQARVTNFVYTRDAVTVHLLDGWDSASVGVPLDQLKNLEPIANWESLREAALAAPFCFSQVLDGTIYSHSVRDRETSLDVDWFNPDPQNHPGKFTFFLKRFNFSLYSRPFSNFQDNFFSRFEGR